jgi:hypothetical protein
MGTAINGPAISCDTFRFFGGFAIIDVDTDVSFVTLLFDPLPIDYNTTNTNGLKRGGCEYQ